MRLIYATSSFDQCGDALYIAHLSFSAISCAQKSVAEAQNRGCQVRKLPFMVIVQGISLGFTILGEVFKTRRHLQNLGNFQFNFNCQSVCIYVGTKESSLFIMDSLSSESEVRKGESSCRFPEWRDHIRVAF